MFTSAPSTCLSDLCTRTTLCINLTGVHIAGYDDFKSQKLPVYTEFS